MGRAKRDLACESSRQVEKLLDRQEYRSRKQRKLSRSSKRVEGDRPGAHAVCGALAVEEPEAVDKVEAAANEQRANKRNEPDEPNVDDWEDVSVGDDDDDDDRAGLGQRSTQNKSKSKSKQTGVVVSLSKEDTEAETQSKKKRLTFTKHDRALCLDVHRTHLLFLLARGLALSAAADDLVLKAVALSLVPFAKLSNDASDRSRMVQEVVRSGFGGSLRRVAGNPEGMDGNVVARLARGPEVNDEQLVVLSAALLRGAGVPTRIVWALDPSPLRPEDIVKKERQAAKTKQAAKKTNMKTSKKAKTDTMGRVKRKTTAKKEEDSREEEGKVEPVPEQTRKRRCDVELEQATAMAIEASSWAIQRKNNERKRMIDAEDGGNTQSPAASQRDSADTATSRYWLEAYVCDKGSWETLHIFPPPSPFVEPYVVAFNGRGAKDLSKKYCAQEQLPRIAAIRDEAWWTRTMASLRRAETEALRECLKRDTPNLSDANEAGDVGVDTAPAADHATRAAEREDRGMAAKGEAARRAVPTTIKGFQNHEGLILKRHIKTHQVLKPGSQAVGMLKGEAYFNRSDVCVVHTAEKWKRQGRIVRENELSRPAKLIKKRGAQQETGLGTDLGNVDQQLMSSFYGPWQTDVWEMPSAKDGIVPKNEWGSVEIPPLAHALPGGTVHVDLPDAAKVCRQLGIDFADAVSGFEYKKRRMVPTKCGVVVCTESEELLRSAWTEYVRHAAKVAKETRLSEGEAAWRDLLAALVTHIRVHRSFADDVEGALLEHCSLKKAKKGGELPRCPTSTVREDAGDEDEVGFNLVEGIDIEEI